MWRQLADGQTIGCPTASRPEALRRLQRQKRVDTKPELAIRQLVHAAGLRYRVDAPLSIAGVRRRADLLFSRAKIAVFVDGCYWHGRPIHGTKPKANAKWWADKVAANVKRHRDSDGRMEAAGWQVVRIWEHEDPARASARVVELVRGRS